jgi:cation/acetate symporter
MIYTASPLAMAIFGIFVLAVLGLSFYLGSKTKSVKGYYAAHGQIPWFINGIAFAGDYLSAASFLGICGMIAVFGYDGFLYSIGYLAGWVVALFVIAEPLKRLGKFTFADALDKKFDSRGIKLAAAISTLVVSIFYLIPQMVGAGALVTPLLGIPHAAGVICVGVLVIVIVATAGMVSTTWVQFIKGSMLVIFCAILTGMILLRGFSWERSQKQSEAFAQTTLAQLDPEAIAPEEGGWIGKPYVRTRHDDGVLVWRKEGEQLVETQAVTVTASGAKLINGRPHGAGEGEADLKPVGFFSKLPEAARESGAVSPAQYLSVFHDSEVVLWGSEKIAETDGGTTTVYFQKPTSGSAIMLPGNSPTFKGIAGDMPTVDPDKPETAAAYRKALFSRLDFISLMLALFCGTASLPHILIRYYTVKDQASARKSTVVGIASIGFFYVLTLFLGLGAMVSGALDVTSSNMAAPLLAKSFGELPFAIVSAIAFTTILGTVSGLILAASGAVAHDLMENYFKVEMTEHGKMHAGKIAAVIVGVIAMFLGIQFEKMNVTFLVGWAFNIAASANLPALIMLLFWKRTTKQGITWAIWFGMISSLGWILLSGQAYKDVYGWDAAASPMPFSQPGLVTIPLGFVVLVIVSLMTKANSPKPISG